MVDDVIHRSRQLKTPQHRKKPHMRNTGKSVADVVQGQNGATGRIESGFGFLMNLGGGWE